MSELYDRSSVASPEVDGALDGAPALQALPALQHTPMNDLGEGIPPLGNRRYERRSSHATPPSGPPHMMTPPPAQGTPPWQMEQLESPAVIEEAEDASTATGRRSRYQQRRSELSGSQQSPLRRLPPMFHRGKAVFSEDDEMVSQSVISISSSVRDPAVVSAEFLHSQDDIGAEMLSDEGKID